MKQSIRVYNCSKSETGIIIFYDDDHSWPRHYRKTKGFSIFTYPDKKGDGLYWYYKKKQSLRKDKRKGTVRFWRNHYRRMTLKNYFRGCHSTN